MAGHNPLRIDRQRRRAHGGAASALVKPKRDPNERTPTVLTVHIGPSQMDRARLILTNARAKRRSRTRQNFAKHRQHDFEGGCLAAELATKCKPTKNQRGYLYYNLHLSRSDLDRMTKAEANELIERNEKQLREKGKLRP